LDRGPTRDPERGHDAARRRRRAAHRQDRRQGRGERVQAATRPQRRNERRAAMMGRRARAEQRWREIIRALFEANNETITGAQLFEAWREWWQTLTPAEREGMKRTGANKLHDAPSPCSTSRTARAPVKAGALDET